MKRCDLLVDVGRRRFLSGAGMVAAGAAASAVLPTAEAKAAVPTARVTYPSNRLANVKDLKPNEPMDVAYPDPDAPGVLLKLGKRVEGGIGPDGDIVGFTTICPHKGYPLAYNARTRTLNCSGPLLGLRLRGRRPGDLGSCHPEPAAVLAAGRRQGRHLRGGPRRAPLRPPVQRALREGEMAYKRQIDRLPIIPADAREHNVVCHYCIVGCGYKAYTWDIDRQGTTDPAGNKFGVDLAKQQGAETEAWYAPVDVQRRPAGRQGRAHRHQARQGAAS